MTFTKVSNPFLPPPPEWLTWPLDVCGRVGYGWFYWFSLGNIFFPNLSGVRIFSLTYNGVRFFFQHYTSWAIFFQGRIFFPRNLFACFFPLEITLQDIFSAITHNPLKSQWSAPKIHQTFGQLTDSDLTIISKGFRNNRGLNSLGERGGIRFYLPLPESPYRRTVTS